MGGCTERDHRIGFATYKAVDYIDGVYKEHPILWVTQVHQTTDPTSLEDLKKRFAWSALRIYDINAEGMRHGVLLGTSRWKPSHTL
jgi:hypothetical protein